MTRICCFATNVTGGVTSTASIRHWTPLPLVRGRVRFALPNEFSHWSIFDSTHANDSRFSMIGRRASNPVITALLAPQRQRSALRVWACHAFSRSFPRFRIQTFLLKWVPLSWNLPKVLHARFELLYLVLPNFFKTFDLSRTADNSQ